MNAIGKVPSSARPDLSAEMEGRFHLALGYFIDQFGWFDYNIGLQLNYWASGKGSGVKRLLAMNASLKDRLDRLMQMVDASTNPVTQKERLDYERWVRRVESIRGLRNDYAHGRWISSNGTSSDNPEMTFVPLQWAMGSKDLRPTVSISISELERQAKIIPALCNQMRKVLVPFLEYRQHPPSSPPELIADTNIDTIWVGPNYLASRIFVLGESWYGDYADNTDHGYISLYLADEQSDGMYTRMANACMPKIGKPARKAAYWNSIMFTNFVQRVGDKRTDRPTKQHYVEARARLLKILQTHKPNAVWVLGKEQAEHSTKIIQSAGIPFVVTAHPTSYGLSNQALGDSWRQLLSQSKANAYAEVRSDPTPPSLPPSCPPQLP